MKQCSKLMWLGYVRAKKRSNLSKFSLIAMSIFLHPDVIQADPLYSFTIQNERELKGTVVDESGKPVDGASIKVKNGRQATLTSGTGEFTILVPKECVLVVTHMGYETQEVFVRDQQSVRIQLIAGGTNLDEVVVIGYGTQSRKETTGSLTSVKGDDVAKVPVQSFDAALGGRSSGVQVNSSAGVLNAAPVFKIRGTNSLSLSTYPLVVIDGVPAFNDNDDSGPSYASANPLSAINPADIESIDIAKDAAATSIYGSRAANGVVFVTTKKVKEVLPVLITMAGWVTQQLIDCQNYWMQQDI